MSNQAAQEHLRLLGRKLLRKEADEKGRAVNIGIVNGEYIRDKLNQEFTQGGHHYVNKNYHFIPDHWIYIDKNLSDKDREATIIHELKEYNLMKYHQEPYDKAHDKANKVEKEFREDEYQPKKDETVTPIPHEARIIEEEHRETLEKVASGEITVDEAIDKTVADHLKESPDYYDPEKGLPAMEERLKDKKCIEFLGQDYALFKSRFIRQEFGSKDSRQYVLLDHFYKFKVTIDYEKTLGKYRVITDNSKEVKSFNKLEDAYRFSYSELHECINNKSTTKEEKTQSLHQDGIEVNSCTTTKEELLNICKEADISGKKIIANVEDEDVEYYQSLGFKIQE